MSPTVQSVVSGVLVVWVLVLTVLVWRRCREPWHDDGRPVYKRLPNGRPQFSWGIAQGLAQAQRHYHERADQQHPDQPDQQRRQVEDTAPITPHRDRRTSPGVLPEDAHEPR